MKISEIKHNKFYEYKVVKRIIPIYVQDILPDSVVAKNMNTNREIFIKTPSQIIKQINSLSEWRLHNGD